MGEGYVRFDFKSTEYQKDAKAIVLAFFTILSEEI